MQKQKKQKKEKEELQLQLKAYKAGLPRTQKTLGEDIQRMYN